MLTPRRTDARRNREAILRAADEAFAQDFEAVRLEEIAHRTGLGRATIYRHFPDQHALGVAVAQQRLREWRQLVRATEEECHSFRDLLHMVLSDQVSRRPLVHLLRKLPIRDQWQYAEALISALTPAFRHAQTDGQIREDVEPADLILVLEMVETAVASPFTAADPETAMRKFLSVILDGFCPPPR